MAGRAASLTMELGPSARDSIPKALPTGAMGAFVALAGLLAVIWMRTGLVPAVSGGDEVWWSESGWHWLREGVLRWACLADDRGSAIVSYWPPIAPLLQAAMIRVFGLTPFGVAAQSSLVCTLLFAATIALARISGLPWSRVLWVPVATFGLFTVERRLMQVRMENLTALFGVGMLCCLVLLPRLRPGLPRGITGAAAGFLLGVGLLCYYPQSPFLLLAFAGAFAAAAREFDWPAAAGVAVGLFGPTLAAAIWILPHRDLFAQQVLASGLDRYVGFRHVLAPFRELIPMGDWLRWLQNLEKWALLILSGFAAFKGKQARTRQVAVAALASSLPMFAFVPSPQVLAGVLGGLLIFLLAEENALPARRRLYLTGAALVALGLGKAGLVGITAWMQEGGRDYARIADPLRALVRPGQHVGITQEAWLALRPVIPDQDLHLLPYAVPSVDNRPVVARSAAAADYFDRLVLQRDRLPDLLRVYPWLADGLHRGQFVVIANIKPEFRPLPWARSPNYDLMVFARQGSP
ncbi:MAG TPA: hypothetical protein VHD61_08200 [Lacunisphaera sp.]|nr:hypothetical protein [Lacunisphaera sp.]